MLEGLDVVIMNPPFGSNMSRSRKFPPYVVKRMQKNELAIKERLKRRDKAAGEAIDSNSIRTFFTPLADRLLNPRRGTLAKVHSRHGLHKRIGAWRSENFWPTASTWSAS